MTPSPNRSRQSSAEREQHNHIDTDTQSQSHTANNIASAMDLQSLITALCNKMDQQIQAAEVRHKAEKDELIAKLSEITTAAATSDSDTTATLTNSAKFQRVLGEFRKSTKVKEFSPLQINVEEWLHGVFDEISIICASKGMKVSDLKDTEKVLLVRSKLPQKISTQLEVFLKRKN